MIFRKVLIFCSLCSLAACGGGGDSSSSDGIQVNFQLTHQQSVDATGNTPHAVAGQKTFKTREGVTVTLKQAYLVVWSVKLESECNSANFALFNVLFPAAAAHTDTTPTQLGVPNVINLLADDAEVARLGEIYPPPGTYCGITVELLKADEDAVGLKDFSINMLNRVLYLEGEYTPLDSTAPIPFTIDVAKTPRPKSLRLTTPLILSATASTAHIGFVTHYDRWFDAVDFTQLNQETQIDWVLNNVTDSFKMN